MKVALCGFLILGLAAAAARGTEPSIHRDLPPLSSMEVIPLHNGPNEVDLDGDGRKDLVFVAWRDNGNAHGYSHVAFYRHGDDEGTPWELVPFFDDRPDRDGVRRSLRQDDSFTTTEGADGKLRAMTLLRASSDPHAPVTVVIGDREFGRSYADAARVKFVVYRLAWAKDLDGWPLEGWPPVYFDAVKTIQGKSRHSYVEEAFGSELGIRVGSVNRDSR